MRERIIEEANALLLDNGYNAFSYKTITTKIDIKTSSIHYHFPTKSDLGVAIIRKHINDFEQTIERTQSKTPLQKLNKLFLYYRRLAQEGRVCIVGSLTSDINTLDEKVRTEIINFSDLLTGWISSILTEGCKQDVFKPIPTPELKAKQLLLHLMALAQVARIDQNHDQFEQMLDMTLNELLQ